MVFNLGKCKLVVEERLFSMWLWRTGEGDRNSSEADQPVEEEVPTRGEGKSPRLKKVGRKD